MHLRRARDHTFEELSAKRVAFLQEPSERPYGVEAVMRDVSGNRLVLGGAPRDHAGRRLLKPRPGEQRPWRHPSGHGLRARSPRHGADRDAAGAGRSSPASWSDDASIALFP